MVNIFPRGVIFKDIRIFYKNSSNGIKIKAAKGINFLVDTEQFQN